MRTRKDAYTTAYELGVNFLDTIEPNPNYAVMFDIDDTLISTKNYKAIKPIVKLVKECNKRGIKVLIITARDNIYVNETIEDLEEIGVNLKRPGIFYDYLYLRHSPEEDHNLFKSNVKEHFAANGIFTIMSIGDNEIDIIGKYSGYSIKLPNVNDPRLFHKDSTGRMVNVKIT